MRIPKSLGLIEMNTDYVLSIYIHGFSSAKEDIKVSVNFSPNKSIPENTGTSEDTDTMEKGFLLVIKKEGLTLTTLSTYQYDSAEARYDGKEAYLAENS